MSCSCDDEIGEGGEVFIAMSLLREGGPRKIDAKHRVRLGGMPITLQLVAGRVRNGTITWLGV